MSIPVSCKPTAKFLRGGMLLLGLHPSRSSALALKYSRLDYQFGLLSLESSYLPS